MTTYIRADHARVMGSRVDVVTLLDQMVRVARFSCGFFTGMAWNKAGTKKQSSELMKKVSFSRSKTRFQFRAVNE